MPEEREFLLADADVLIDYVASDLAILALVHSRPRFSWGFLASAKE